MEWVSVSALVTPLQVVRVGEHPFASWPQGFLSIAIILPQATLAGGCPHIPPAVCPSQVVGEKNEEKKPFQFLPVCLFQS